MSIKIQPVNHKSLAETAAGKLAASVLDGSLASGTQLPTSADSALSGARLVTRSSRGISAAGPLAGDATGRSLAAESSWISAATC